MNNLPKDKEDLLREPFIAPNSESADSDPAQPFDSAEQPVREQQPADALSPSVADPAAPAPVPPDNTYIPESSIQPSPQLSLDQPLFQSYLQPPVRHPVRIPHFGHLLLVSLLIAAAAGILGLGLGIVSYFHLFGWHLSAASATDLKFDLVSEIAIYFIAFAFSLIVFPMIWHEGYFAGLQWRAAAVRTRFWPLAGTALLCFGVAILDEFLMPSPANAPIEKMLSSPSAAWLLFIFGITAAPFFEEMFFRGFLLPALSTAYDWIGEQVKGKLPLPLDATGHPQWSLSAMVVASVITSVIFALLHVAQQGHSLGPFLLLILVSLVLCAVRLITRSLAASTVVHAIYNFLIFAVELGATGGFRHFDKM